MLIKFEIIGEIKTKARPRASYFGGHSHIYTPKDTLYYENYVRECYLNAVKDKEFKSFGNKPLSVNIIAYFKAPKKYKKYRDDIHYLACDKNKDCDNIAKIVLDSLNKVAYDDDKQIVNLTVNKFWTNKEEKIAVWMDRALTDDLEKFKVAFKPKRKENS